VTISLVVEVYDIVPPSKRPSRAKGYLPGTLKKFNPPFHKKNLDYKIIYLGRFMAGNSKSTTQNFSLVINKLLSNDKRELKYNYLKKMIFETRQI